MAGDSPAEAVRAFTEPIQAALSCFATGKVAADSFDPARPGTLTFNRAEPVRLCRFPRRVDVTVVMTYRVVEHQDEDRGPWKVSTTGWIHDLHVDGVRVAAYHWHPISSSHASWPHLHIGTAKTHFPTGRVLVEDALVCAVDLGVPAPLAWTEVQAGNRRRFALGATWGTPPVIVGS